MSGRDGSTFERDFRGYLDHHAGKGASKTIVLSVVEHEKDLVVVVSGNETHATLLEKAFGAFRPNVFGALSIVSITGRSLFSTRDSG